MTDEEIKALWRKLLNAKNYEEVYRLIKEATK